MVLCCSHTGYRTAREAIDHSPGPIIFSHSNPRTLRDHPRNIPNDLIRACAARGGVIGINGLGTFLGANDNSTEALVRHIDHVVQLVGDGHVALGLDYVYDSAELDDYLEKMAAIFPKSMGYEQIQALRLQLSDTHSDGVGWLFALADKRMRAVINAMHEAPGAKWTLQTLAGQAAMSRTTFALRFKDLVGLSSMDYLTRWRMTLAADRPMHSRDSVATIGLALGYESEKSFSTAFKRVMNCSPRQYGRRESAGVDDVH